MTGIYKNKQIVLMEAIKKQLSGAGYKVSAALEVTNKVFLQTSRAREAALDGGFQMHYEKTPFEQLAFIKELFSLIVVNRLTKELGCDEIIVESVIFIIIRENSCCAHFRQ
ncbi:PREDICTED: EP300-interacting inhibitor of differentiation 1-like [Chrysochloris asiatica]|uniref:EP300-interacting inhibitor of differentiation 1-like n=1 Tax=Chrysochloris asiatica TaxID=185453 RepID=A0A9B0U5K6_CHRAS|nr:PREDICTED: EP300-interacting inhibitor of differentiation 1-like [Chrysochloris asiatica]